MSLKNISSLLQKKALRQSLLLFGSQLLLVFVGLGIKYIQTNALGDTLYGIYAFWGTITGFIALFFRFGFVSAMQVILSKITNHIQQRETIAASLLTMLIISLLYVLTLVAFSFFVDGVFDTKVGVLLFTFAPLCIVFPLVIFQKSVAIGTNQFMPWISFNLGSKVLFLVSLLFFWQYSFLNIKSVILLNTLSALVAFAFSLYLIKPIFRHTKKHFKTLYEKNKTFGFNFYLGTISNLSTFQLDQFLIVYFLSNTTLLGYYTLAIVICSPMVMLSQSLANALFKKFAVQNRISSPLIYGNLLWLCSCVLGLYLTGDLIVDIFLGKNFETVKSYIFPLSIAYFFQGLYQPYNFLTAKSQGKQIRNVAFLESIFNIVGNLILIPIFGVFGAIYASIFAKTIHWLAKVYYYNQYLKKTTI